MSLYSYEDWPNFSREELECSQTGAENPNVQQFSYLMDKVQELRTWYGEPMYVTSGYRSKKHPIEARKLAKGNPAGQHNTAAIDFRVPTDACHEIIEKMFQMGFRGIGVNLTGDPSSRFIHGDFRVSPKRLWSY